MMDPKTRRLRGLCSGLLLSAVLLLALAASAVAAPTVARPVPTDPHQALVEFVAGTTIQEVRAVAAAHQGALVRPIKRYGTRQAAPLYWVMSPTLTSAQLAQKLNAEPTVKRATASYPIVGDATYPNDPAYWSEQYNMPRISAPAAWDLTVGSPSVVVVTLDSGITYGHEDLAANVWKNAGEVAGNGLDDDGNGYVDDVYGWDAFNGDGDPADDGTYTHGTHVAGIVGAVGNNGLGVAGVAWNTKLMAVKVLGSNLVGSNASAIAGIYYAIKMKQSGVNIVAINASWGGFPDSTYPPDPDMLAAIRAARDAGIVWSASAGNNNVSTDSQPRYPSCYDSDNIVTAAATNEDDSRWYLSNWGPATVDVAAPGAYVYSTVAAGGETYELLSGTSMAAPHVAGAVALCASRYPNETYLQRVDRVLTGVDKIPALAGVVGTGGRLNVYKALTGDMRPVTTVSGADTAWHKDPVELTFTASDAGVGVDYTESSIDGAAYQRGTSVTVSTDGQHTVSYRSVDKAGNVEAAKTVTVKMDTSAPDVQSDATGEWQASPVTVNVTATDAQAGVATIEYRLDGAEAWTSVAAASVGVEIATGGVHTLEVRATDNVGNVSQPKTYTVKVNTETPTISVSGADSDWHSSPVTVVLTGSSSLGIERIEYRLVGAAQWTAVQGSQAVLTVGAEGVNSYECRSVALSGVTSAIASFVVKVDTTAPVSTIQGADTAWHNTPVPLTLTATDAGSGVLRTEYSLNNGAWTPATSFSVAVQGVSTVRYRAVDAAGNVEAIRSVQVRVDSVAPTTAARPSRIVRNTYGYLYFRVSDALPTSGQAVVTSIVIYTSSGAVARTYSYVGTFPVNQDSRYRILASLPIGTYTFRVFARDIAGNVATTTTPGTLTVARY